MTPDEAAAQVRYLVDTYPTITLSIAASTVLAYLDDSHTARDIDDATYLAGVRAVADVIAERAS